MRRTPCMALVLLAVSWTAITAAPVDSEAPAAPSAAEARSTAYAHLMRAMLAARRGEFTAAATEIDDAVRAQPDSPELLVEAARMLSWTGRSNEAERNVRRALEIDDANVEALSFLGDLLLARALSSPDAEASMSEALAVYEKLAAAEDPPDPDVMSRIVQLRHRSGDLDGAVEAARRVVELRPGDATASRALAQLLLQGGQERPALEALLGYVAAHPAADDLALFAEQLSHNLEAWDLVVGRLEPAAPFPVQARVTQRLLGEAYLRAGRMEDAARTLELARKGSPSDLRVRNQLALAYRGVGRMADASELLNEMIGESPDFPSFRQLLGETLELQGDAEGALAAYNAALERWGDDADAAPVRDAIRLRMALLRLGRGEFDEAERLLDEVENDEGPLPVRIRGRLAVESGDWDGARRVARRLRGLDEVGLGALLEGEVFARQGKWSKADSRFEEAVELLGDSLRRRVAEIYRTNGKPDEGRALMEAWVQKEPENADARFLLGEYLYLVDRFEAAEPELREAFRLDPEHAAALNFLGYSYAERSTRLDEALDLVQRALSIDSWNGAYLDSLGWVYFQMGRYEDARDPLERAAREMPKDATILDHLGDMYAHLGEHQAAVAAWDRALAAEPEDAGSIQRKLEAQRGVIAESDTSSLLPPN